MGDTNGTVQTWTDTQILATVATGAGSGKAQVLQRGVWSNAVPFTVNSLHITTANPSSGLAGTGVTITGTGFGTVQGTGSVILGSAAGQVMSWSDTQIIASVAAASVTGVVRVQQNNQFSNALTFTVPTAGASPAALLPNVLTMTVGEARTLQARSSSGQTVSGLAWTSSNSNVVSLSVADPPVLTALAAGHVTVKAGAASADVTVLAADPAIGTVLWSNPGSASGVNKLVPAVPSSNGIADVFAFQNDGTVQAITSDGTTAWTADVSGADRVVPDFQGGLIVVRSDDTYPHGIATRLDGITGAAYPSYGPAGTEYLRQVVPNTDGSAFALLTLSVTGFNPASGAEIFRAPLSVPPTAGLCTSDLIVAGDGNAYLAYMWISDFSYQRMMNHLRILKVSSGGAATNIVVNDWPSGFSEVCSTDMGIITNADQGVLVTWKTGGQEPQMALVSSAGAVSIARSPSVPGQTTAVRPVLQEPDGSFVGAVQNQDAATKYMLGFQADGTANWMVADEDPSIATVDRGVTAASGTTYSSSGEAISYSPLPVYSWTSRAYEIGSTHSIQVRLLDNLATSFWAFAGGSFSQNYSSGPPVDNATNNKAKKILGGHWAGFAKSHCAAVFANPGGGIASNVLYYSLDRAKKKMESTNFYDVSSPDVARLTVQQVTAGESSLTTTLSSRLSTNNAATENMGETRKWTIVILKAGILSSAKPQFLLFHEVLVHAYGNWSDDAVFGSTFFQQNGLWRDSLNFATVNLTLWMGTDCKCTPGRPGTDCPPETATW